MHASVCSFVVRSYAATEKRRVQGAHERQVQAEEEARLMPLAAQSGMKLTLTKQVCYARALPSHKSAPTCVKALC